MTNHYVAGGKTQKGRTARPAQERPSQGRHGAGGARADDRTAQMAGGAIGDGQRRQRLAPDSKMTRQEYSPDPNGIKLRTIWDTVLL